MQVHLEVNGRLRVVRLERRDGHVRVEVDGHEWLVDVRKIDSHTLSVRHVPTGRQREIGITGGPAGEWRVHVDGRPIAVRRSTGVTRRRHGETAAEGPERVTAPMPGKVVRVLVKPGDTVVERQGVVVVEAMKMENELRTSRAGTVQDVFVREGASVEAGAPLVLIA